MLAHRVFRLFVSSTFSDFIAEREALQKEVFPELERYCAKRGARFQAVDLRWGITEEAQREHNTMRICLEEVRRCQQLSPRPNFAVLLGDRYGWEPVPARIPQDHWRRLRKDASDSDRKLIEDSYRLDENAIPAVYCLRERDGDQSAAFQHEARLLLALRRAARGMRGGARLPYFASATHQEIALGALSRRDEQGRALHPERHVHVYIRRLRGLPKDGSAKDFIDWDASQAQVVPGARDRLRGLEDQLSRQLGDDHAHELRTTWSRHGRDGAVSKAYLAGFCEAFLSHQKALIDAELDALGQIDERQQREQAHNDFGAERARVFAGRKTLLVRIARYTASTPKGKGAKTSKRGSPAAPLVLLGSGGSGKSALLARAAQEAISGEERAGTVILQRYIGGVPGSEALTMMLADLTADIASIYGQPPPPAPENAKALTDAFQHALGHASAERPLALYLDALDQLDSTDGAWMLDWLPKELPDHVCVVASARTGTSVEQSVRRRFPRGVLEVPPMTPAEGAAMLDAWLADRRGAWFNASIAPCTGRSLKLNQRAAVLDAFKENGSALWLKLASEEAATWTSWDKPRKMPAAIHGLIEDLVDNRLLKQENHPAVFTKRALAYLTAGRSGLSEIELARALGTDPAVRAEFRANEKTQRKWEDAQALPPILWSRLFFDLQAYLGIARMDGALLMRWFHREFTEVLEKRYLDTAQERRAVHGTLADTFLALERGLRPKETTDAALFRSTDVGGTQVSAALRRVMEQPWQLAQADRPEDLRSLLTDFGFCMGKCAANRAADLINDFRSASEATAHDTPMRAWSGLLGEKGHMLRRGEQAWPAHKILLQIASEHADDSPVTRAAAAWLSEGHCDWVWLRNRKRPERQTFSGVLAVLEGHSSFVQRALVLPDGRLLSWSGDGTLRLWDGTSGAPLAVLEGHTDVVFGALVLPDGRLLSWSADRTLRLWDGTSGAPLAMLDGHTGGVDGAVVLPDGRPLSWSGDGTLRLWDGASGAALAALEGHTKSVLGVHVLPSGRLMSWSWDKTPRLWDGTTGALLTAMDGHTKGVLGVHVLPCGRALSWSYDGTLRLWDGASGAPLAVLEGHKGGVNGASVLPDGRLMSWSRDGTLRLWDGASGAPLAVLEGHKGGVNGALVMPDGRLLSWSWDKTLRMWSGASGAPLAVLEGHTEGILDARILPDGRVLSRDDHTLHLWDGRSGASLANMVGHAADIGGGQIFPDGRVLSWSDDGTLRLWDDQNGAMLSVLEGHTEAIRGVQICGHGRVLSWSRDGTLRLWDAMNCAPPAAIHGHTGWVSGALVLPNGRLLTWSQDHTLRLWDGITGVPVAVLEGHQGPIDGVCVLPDSRLVSWTTGATSWSVKKLAQSSDQALCIWDSQRAKLLSVLSGHIGPILGALVLPNGCILSWSADNTLRSWDYRNSKVVVLRGHISEVLGALTLPDGRILSWSSGGMSVSEDGEISPSFDRTLRLWHGDTGAPIAVLEGHTAGIDGARLLGGGRLLSWSVDCTMRLWDSGTGAPLAMLEGHIEGISGTQELPSGRLLSWSRDRTLRLWDSGSGAPLAVLEGHAGSIEGACALPDGRLLSWSSDQTLRLWDGASGASLAVFRGPWTETSPYPAPWEALDAVAGAKRIGNSWYGEHRNYLYVVNRKAGWLARWQGDGAQLFTRADNTIIAASGHNLLFLDLMVGGSRMDWAGNAIPSMPGKARQRLLPNTRG